MKFQIIFFLKKHIDVLSVCLYVCFLDCWNLRNGQSDWAEISSGDSHQQAGDLFLGWKEYRFSLVFSTFSFLIISLYYGSPIDSTRRMKIDLVIAFYLKHVLDFDIELLKWKIITILWVKSIKKEIISWSSIYYKYCLMLRCSKVLSSVKYQRFEFTSQKAL